ncbi:hypothetical protein AVEN_169818-1 [Araneus ventricosus]|uniref:Uncharacterized protein n=1 Tax=Araneus ventricosus TaxID=182803 RepID=A0A4Y2SDB2_ARAVE|nr:hypothetical protein AVEN_169818-1 [Araneus ventricosus]
MVYPETHEQCCRSVEERRPVERWHLLESVELHTIATCQDLSSGTGGLLLAAANLILIKLFQGLVRCITVGRKKPPGPVGLPVVRHLPFLGKEPHKTF